MGGDSGSCEGATPRPRPSLGLLQPRSPLLGPPESSFQLILLESGRSVKQPHICPSCLSVTTRPSRRCESTAQADSPSPPGPETKRCFPFPGAATELELDSYFQETGAGVPTGEFPGIRALALLMSKPRPGDWGLPQVSQPRECDREAGPRPSSCLSLGALSCLPVPLACTPWSPHVSSVPFLTAQGSSGDQSTPTTPVSCHRSGAAGEERPFSAPLESRAARLCCG